MMKTMLKNVLLATAALMTFATAEAKNEKSESENQVAYLVTTDANGEIASATPMPTEMNGVWHIRDLSGMTNIRSAPNGQVCMKLKAWTQYAISTNGSSGQWLAISSIYNMKEKYWVRLHGSKTGTYWIASSILYKK